MRTRSKATFLLSLLMSLAISSGAQGAESKKKIVVLSTTTSTQDSGLLDVLLPLFEKETGYSVKAISVGTGQARGRGLRGDAAPAAKRIERGDMEGGCRRRRRLGPRAAGRGGCARAERAPRVRRTA